MAWTKRQIVVAAYEEIGYADYNYDLQPEQLEAGMRRLDAMMAAWNGIGIRLGYPIPSSPENSDLDQESGIPDYANEAAYTNLACKIAPGVGKQVSLETKKTARETYRILLQRAALPTEQQFPETLPRGSGNKPWRDDRPFVDPPTDPIDAGRDGPLNFY